jgi:glycosyltransferase involved in cell wall biosynthesis
VGVGAAVDGARAAPAGARLAVVGISTRRVCGVRDHALLLADALGRDDVSCTLHWLSSAGGSLSVSRARLRTWTSELAVERDRSLPKAILFHYSVFAYSHRGLPLFVHPTLVALRRTHIPVVTVLHELVYPWLRGGLRGSAWAVSQRAALVEVMRASSAVLVTADFRAEWLASRPWLPRRPVAVAPVFSNLPRSTHAPPATRAVPVVGLFGYSLDPPTIALVADALRALADRDVRVRLELLGAPGRPSAVADAWLQAAGSRGVADALSFSGTLPAQELSDALAVCDVLLYADAMGPASRKGTLAASLASGRPLVALEGRRRWVEFLESDVACVVARTARALAEALGALLGDERAREELGARGRAFAERTMGVARTAEVVRGLLGDVLAGTLHAGSPGEPRSERHVEPAAR